MTQSIALEHRPEVDRLLRLGDTCLVLGQRLGEWCGHAPILEEDIALANIALDLIGQTRALLTHAGQVEGRGLGEDQLAFLREERDYRNLTLVELPRGDFAFAMLRILFGATWLEQHWQRLAGGEDAELAGIAAKALKEARYHRQHAADWVLRLAGGTDESRRRSEAALDELWRYVPELFAGDDAELEQPWRSAIGAVLEQAALAPPADGGFRSHGRDGIHTEHLGRMLAEMQFLQRAYPGGVW